MYGHIRDIEEEHWWYVARRKIVFEWVFRVLAGRDSPRVLDVGCGTGFNMEYLQANGYRDVVGLDVSTEALFYCRSRDLSPLVCGDGASLPLRDASFDLILALDMLEHLAGDVLALQEFARLLAPGGSLLLFVPALPLLWGLQDEVSHHYRRYTSGELARKLGLAGLSVKKLTYANMFLFPLILAGRTVLSLFGNRIRGTSENDLHPGWSNGMLQAVFAAERPLLRYMNLPLGVSMLCVAQKAQPPDLLSQGASRYTRRRSLPPSFKPPHKVEQNP